MQLPRLYRTLQQRRCVSCIQHHHRAATTTTVTTTTVNTTTVTTTSVSAYPSGNKLVVTLDCCFFNGREDREEDGKMIPDDWDEMSADEKVRWASGNLNTGADATGAGERISIPEGLREDGRGYVFELVQERPNGGNVAVGRICFFDYSA